MATELTAADARTRLIFDLHPAIREFVLAVDELGLAIQARDLGRVERSWRRVQAREAEYLEVAAQ
jgi:hypothetical protein